MLNRWDQGEGSTGADGPWESRPGSGLPGRDMGSRWCLGGRGTGTPCSCASCDELKVSFRSAPLQG